MKTIKVIELLNKIANGEEVPKKIKWGVFILEWEELDYHDYKFLDTGRHLLFQGITTSVLNDELEIIEEKKLPEKLNDNYAIYDENGLKVVWSNVQQRTLKNKINEIIDYLESKEKGE